MSCRWWSTMPLPYARPDTRRSFQADGQSIHINNAPGRWHAYFVWAIAAAMIAFPVVRGFLPGSAWIVWDELGAIRWIGAALYALVVFSLISAGFWSESVHIDLVSRRVLFRQRKGPFRRERSESLARFDRVVLARDGDGASEVHLAG